MKKIMKLTAVLCAIALVAVFAVGCTAEPQDNTLMVVEDTSAFEREEYGMAIAQGNDELLTAVNAVLAQMIERGYISYIAAKHTEGMELPEFQINPVEFAGETVVEGYLTMATNAEFAPFEFRSNAPGAVDGVYGIDVDIARVVANALGLQLRVEDMEFTSVVPAVETGMADIGIAAMTITEERALRVNFTIPYYLATQAIIARADSGITSAADLVGLRVGVVMGYTGDIVVTAMDGVAEIVRSNSGPEAVMELINNRVDVVVIDRAPAEAIVRRNNQ